MPKVIPKNVADEMTRPYIDDAVDKQLKAADVPPRNKLDISFKDAGRTDDNKDYDSNQDAYEENHGKLYEMTHGNTIPWKNYVVYFVLLSLLTTVFTFSKYVSGANVSGEAVVANFKYSIEGSYLKDGKKVSIETNAEKPNYSDNQVILGDNVAAIPFEITNDSDVTVTVTPSCEAKSGNKGYVFSFKDGSTSSAKLVTDKGIDIGTAERKKTLYLWIDASGATTDQFVDLDLEFFVAQKD